MRGDGVADCKQMNAIAIIASGTRFGDANGTFAPVVYADSAVRGDGAPHYSLYTVPRRYSRMIFGATLYPLG